MDKWFRFFTTQSDLVKFNGSRIEILEPLDEREYDREDVGPMYKARFNDGEIRDVFEDELV